MRQGTNTRRSRGRGNNNGRRQNVPLRNQTFDSNGPDVRIRGNAYQVYEKYLALARDANAAGDRIGAENYYQHAEHYFRIIGQINEMNGDGNRNNGNRRDNGNGNGHAYNGADDEGDGREDDEDQPVAVSSPQTLNA